ncbi:gliding motility lipoprotein GldB [Aequorivita marisscotiae]|uniref:Gliding motility lipoprotein GldB n=1 Tax=Aequorivita marisscotiae TaxID=3040348 RepID=A0ABY8KXS4_9FLAO|nr:gliding motility lipoprotein GldB [Aequorivita sp. Ant34-E75]WGF92855.1 gliding motility lipoprotein GldB [Aequorivita sp. Ant34-E75]
MIKYLIAIFFGVLFFSCNSKSEVEKEIEKIPMNVEVIRFDKAFAAASPENLPKLKKEFPAFFPEKYHDSIWVQKLTDTLQNQLEQEVLKQFPNEGDLKEILEPLFQHIKYYFPKFTTPVVVAATSDVDYRNKVILADSMLVIGLDNYLGSDHKFYQGIDKYIAKEMKPSQIGPDVAEIYARQHIKIPNKRTFLAQIVYFGKELYLKDLWLPNTTDAAKIGYTEEEYIWAEENEEYMWRYFIEKELLYSTDPKLAARFVSPAPFSKFYLEIDNESPGMLGKYLGWKIVRAYMKNNDTNVQQLMVTNADEIFTNSKYKPKK